MKENESKRLLRGALLLAVAGLIGKVLGASYRIPLQNLTGDAGFYVYQQVYPFLALALMFSLYGFPSAVATLIRSDRSPSWFATYRPALIIMGLYTLIVFTLITLLSGPLSIYVGDPELRSLYKMVAVIFLFIPFTALLRGMYQSELLMGPVAGSQLIEQFLRVAILIYGAWFISSGGNTIYTIGIIAVYAAIAGSVVALIYLLLFLKKLPRSHNRVRKTRIDWRKSIQIVALLGTVATLNHALLILMQAIDAVTMVPNLLNYGYTFKEAAIEKGVFDRGQPFIQIGSVLGSSFALAVMPTISKKRLQQNPLFYETSIHATLKSSLVLGVGATVGLVMLMPTLNKVLFTNTLGSSVLQIFMLAVGFATLAMTGIAIVQGLGSVYKTAIWIVGAMFIKWALNTLLIPEYGSLGSAVATIGSLIYLVISALGTVRKLLPSQTLFGQSTHFIRALLISTFILIGTVFLLRFWMEQYALVSRMFSFGWVLFIAGVGSIIFMIFLIRLDAFTKAELRELPKQRMIQKIAQIGRSNRSVDDDSK